jgi:GNAT superfamily N-acetyltransferase
MARSRFAMILPLERQRAHGMFTTRPVVPSDASALSQLLYAAFRGSIDDEGETPADARYEIDRLFRGDYGRFDPATSVLIEEDGALQSACLISWFDVHAAPLVVFSMSRPEARRRGMARHLLKVSINALLDRGERFLTLVVTEGNTEAISLYRSLGFRRWNGQLPPSYRG